MATQSVVCKTILPNGVRVLSERVPYVDSVSVGIWANTGSRDEDDQRRGISHFVEHMLFKGTERRSARDIAVEMDCLGGNINAFTDKEHTCYYAKVLQEHLPDALGILTDMVMNSVLDTEEIEREKNVVIEEIKRHQDTPEEHVHDLLAETLWHGYRIGQSVIGLADVIQRLTREELLKFMGEFYCPDALVISAAGNVDHRAFVDMVGEAFGALQGSRPKREACEIRPCNGSVLIDKNTEQVQFCLGLGGFSQRQPERFALATIDSVLGGGMSSRLFQEIRENRGLAYAVGSYTVSYQEAGLFALYGGTSVENVKLVLELAKAECESMGKNSVTDAELERAKNQIRGALVLGQESMSNRMSRLAKSEMYFGRVVRLDEIIKQITNVSKDDVARVASEMFGNAGYALAAVGPFKRYPELVEGGLVPEPGV